MDKLPENAAIGGPKSSVGWGGLKGEHPCALSQQAGPQLGSCVLMSPRHFLSPNGGLQELAWNGMSTDKPHGSGLIA